MGFVGFICLLLVIGAMQDRQNRYVAEREAYRKKHL